jgi:anhydro-N-acetylmuramic acid kinase
MDLYTRKNIPGKYFDEGAEVAKKGKVQAELMDALKQHEFFGRSFPKSTGPELFNEFFLEAAINKLAQRPRVEDILATLNYFTAEIISDGISGCVPPGNHCKLYISGGGSHNPLLIKNLKQLLTNKKVDYKIAKDKSIGADSKEAILMALLANECVAGNPEVFGKGSEIMPSVSFGKISFPG